MAKPSPQFAGDSQLSASGTAIKRARLGRGCPVKVIEIHSSEMDVFPFPRSRISIESLARYRGSSSEFKATKTFQLLRERI